MDQLWTKRLGIFALLATVFLSGCGIIYTDIEGPRAYRSATPIDVQSKNRTQKVVIGESCYRSVLWLVAWGGGGYVPAVENALKGEPPGSILYDVQTDAKAQVYVFGMYAKVCTVVRGKVATP